MFTNTAARRSAEEIRNEMKELGAQKRVFEDECRVIRDTWRITDNHIKNKVSGVPKEVWDRRAECTKEITQINYKLAELKKEFREAHLKIDAERNIALMGVFAEIFSDAQRAEIMNEIDRRRKGEQPVPTGFDFKELDRYKKDYYKYRQLSKEYLEKMIEFRILLTSMIKDGCEKFGDAEFLKFISPLNRLIIPVDELEKIKRKNFL